MRTKVTMSDIAQELDVSAVTVSRALAGKDGVGEAMREKILQKASDMGYQFKQSDGLLLSGQSVGILISSRFISVDHSFYWALYEQILESLGKNDAFGLMEAVKEEEEERCELPRLVRSGRVQALLAIGRFSEAYLRALAGAGLPAVQLDEYSAGTLLDTVISDGYYGMYFMTDYLLRRGHRDIAYLGQVGATSSITDRYFGFCRAMQEWHVPIRPEWVIPDRQYGGRLDVELPGKLPTAFACNCDMIAYKLIQRLGERGLRVPEDVSLTGFDGYAPSAMPMAITTYAVDMAGMAQASVLQLSERMANPEKPLEVRIVPGHLREEASVKPIPLS